MNRPRVHPRGCGCAECVTVRCCIDDIARVVETRSPTGAAWERVIDHFLGHTAAAMAGTRKRWARTFLEERARGAFKVYRGIAGSYTQAADSAAEESGDENG